MKKKIALISTDWSESEYRRINKAYGGVSYYRLVKPMEALRKDYDVDYFHSTKEASEGMGTDDFFNRFTKKYDMILIKAVDNAEAIQPLIHWATHNKCLLVQDFDDNMLVIREDQPAHRFGYREGGQKRAYCASMLSLVDAVIVSTEPLKDYFEKFCKDMFGHLEDYKDPDIHIYPNYSDVADWDGIPNAARDPEKVVIGWAGSITHDSDLKMMMPALGRVVEKHSNVHVELLGGIVPGKLAEFTKGWSKDAKKRVQMKFGCQAWDKYPALMKEQAWDIGIAPLVDDEFNKGKSHIKWMEYAMCGTPCVASDVYPYSMNIPADCGMLTAEDQWEDNLTYLVENADARKVMATNAYDHIASNLQWKDHAEDYLGIVRGIFEKNKESKGR